VRRIALTALLLSATLANGQWLGEKLSLLDEFGIPAGHQSLAYNNHNHTVYLSGDDSDSILVIDADRCKSMARVAVGGRVRAMGFNPRESKLYCAYAEADTVVVLDGATDQVLALVPVGDSAGTFCFDSIGNKMYVGNWGSGSVSVIDCRIDAVVATIDGCGGSREAPNGMCFVAAHQSVYVTSRSDSSVVVIDCSSDSVLARIPVGRDPLALCYNPTNDRVYCACWYNSVCGIDAASNHVVSVIPRGYALSLACDPARNVLFVPDGGELVVVDCGADTVVAGIELPDAGAGFVEYDPEGSKIYVANDVDGCWTPGSTIVLDGESYKVLTWFTAFYTIDAVRMIHAPGRLFVAGVADEGLRIIAIDGLTGRLRGAWRERSYPFDLLPDPKRNKLYCLDDAYLVTVVDATAGTLRATVPVAGYPVTACIDADHNKVYVATVDWHVRGKIAVLDAIGDTLLTEVITNTDPVLLVLDSADEILCATSDGDRWLQAVDCRSDLLFDSLRVDEYPVGLVFSEARRKFYSLGRDSTITVVDPMSFCIDGRIHVGTGLDRYAVNSDGSRIYGGSLNHSAVYIIDCSRDTLDGTIPVFGPPIVLCYDATHDRLYGATDAEGGMLSVIDCSRDSVVANVPVNVLPLYCDSATDAVYCLGADGITVVDGRTCAVLKTVPTDPRPLDIASAPGWASVFVACGRYGSPCLVAIHKALGPAEMAVQAEPSAQATVVRGRLDWTGTLAVMYDKSGRRVADVHRGGNDVSRLQPGVYFVRQNGVRRGTYARKVIVTR